MVFFTRVHPPPALLVVSHRQQLWPVFSPTPSFSVNPSRLLPLRMHAGNRRWDSNAETFRTRNFDFDSTEDDDDFEDDDSNQWLDILEDFIDGVWIFKAFRSFGWMLPAIISSLLLTSGPKAFLMALAIPMGQSALSLLFQTVWGRPRTKTRRRGKSKRKQPPPRGASGAASYTDVEQEQERKSATGYQTWVAGDESSDDKTNGSSSSFGGWEELEGRRTRSKTDGNRKQSKSKMSRRVKRSETPLLLRLLIAVFPFLGSWTKLL
ncbi:hypothetical protein L1987_33372 [Smallanthus sonchifolius]|uniref:Uncharacterized protein n=1 Tax=Smallanthus sonchifolius TaxID=185202 RepID=A0ACB9HRP0_9ASTR|nr:hypothetical protein L1987_33372 [Smallanthus sonchifolius]